jgi:hypothetical protein
MNFFCMIGLHDYCIIGDVKIPAVRGPFDPDHNRTVTRSKEVCAKCGKETLFSYLAPDF